MKHPARLLALLLLLVLAVPGRGGDGLVIVVHPDFPVQDIKLNELSKIFLGRINRLAGAAVNPVNKEAGTAERTQFDQKVHRMDDSAMKEYWLGARIKGEGMPPRSFHSDAAILRYVTNVPGAIGYVAFPPPAGLARGLSVDGVAPSERTVTQGSYPLAQPVR